jgi:Fic family protein
MSQPLLYISSYFEANYNKYIDYMYEVSKSGAWEQWIEFFLAGIEISARKAIKKIHALEDLRTRYMDRVRAARTSALLPKIVDSLFFIPAITVPHTVYELRISYNSAKNNLQKLVDLGILPPHFGNERPQWFFALEIIHIADVD